MAQADIGLIGLAVMGQNLVLNMDDHGYRVAVYNRTTSKVDAFLAGPAAGTRVLGCHSLEQLVAALEPPRKLMLMVRAGEVVDRFIDALVPADELLDAARTKAATLLQLDAESHALTKKRLRADTLRNIRNQLPLDLRDAVVIGAKRAAKAKLGR